MITLDKQKAPRKSKNGGVMKKDVLKNEIIKLLKTYCKPETVTGFFNELSKAEKFEQELLGARRNGRAGRRNHELSISEPDKLDYLITLCQNTLEEEETLQVILGIGDLFKTNGDLARAEELYSKVVSEGEELQKDRFVAEAYIRRGEVYCRQGRWKDSNSDLSQSRRIFQKLKKHADVGRVENILGTNYTEQGKLKQAHTYFQKALKAFERAEEKQMVGSVLMNLGVVHSITGQEAIALSHYQRARSHFEEIGDLTRLGELRHNMGMTYLHKSSFNDAIREFDASFALGSRTGNVNLMGLASLGKATAEYHLHDQRMALKLVNQAFDHFVKSNDRLSMADAYKVKGMILREMKKYNFAYSYLQSSLRINRELENKLNIGETSFELGILEKRRGRRKPAKQALENALIHFEKVGAGNEAQRTKQELDSIGKKNNDV